MKLRFDEMISSPSRLAILSALMPGPPVSFTAMKTVTGVTDGNLHVQTRKLADAGYIRIRKTRHGRRSVTEFSLTDVGLDRFQLHVRKLQLVMDTQPGMDTEAAVSRPPQRTVRADDSMVWS